MNQPVTIRDFSAGDYPAIVQIHKSLGIVWPERPRTPEGWEAADKNRHPKCQYRRWVAEEKGEVAGFATYGQSIFDYHPQRFYVNVEVHPAHQGQGVGAALCDQVMDGLRPFDPRVLRADAFANLPQGWHFLQKRGFFEAFRETPVHLDVAAFDPSPYTHLEVRLKEKGIVIKTVRELEDDPERDRKIYELYCEVEADLPREEAEVIKPEFEDWLKWGLYDPTILHDAYFVAVRGDEYIGLRELGKDPDNHMLLGGMLGVRRAERKQGIGLALQLRGIAYARDGAYPMLKTCTAIQNVPMQALFNKLGYARDPEWQQCQKDLNGN